MIGSLQGTVLERAGNIVTLDVNGVGYEVCCSQNCLVNLQPGETARITVYTDVKEDSIKLYGFEDKLERQTFLLLTAVKGVGARSASEMLSRIDKLDLLRIIGAGDAGRLQAVKGIGKKTAERIIVELKDKVAEFAAGQHDLSLRVEREVAEPYEDAIDALLALGFGRRDAERAVQQVRGQVQTAPLDSGQIVKEALRYV